MDRVRGVCLCVHKERGGCGDCWLRQRSAVAVVTVFFCCDGNRMDSVRGVFLHKVVAIADRSAVPLLWFLSL